MKSIITFILLAFISVPCFSGDREDFGALIVETDTRIQKLQSSLSCVKGTPDAVLVIHEIYLAELDRLGYLSEEARLATQKIGGFPSKREEQQKKDSLLRKRDSWLAYDHGLFLKQAGINHDALSALNTALVVDPEFIEARVERAIVLLELNEPERALKDLELVNHAQPERLDSYYFMAHAWEIMGSSNAIDTYRLYLGFNSKSKQLRYFAQATSALERLLAK
jgi:hypothetical protein